MSFIGTIKNANADVNALLESLKSTRASLNSGAKSAEPICRYVITDEEKVVVEESKVEK